MPAILQGQIFPSLQDFKNALRDWAIERNWTPHILDSDSHRVRAGCRSSPDCPFRIRANFSIRRGNAKVTTCDDNHTCEPFRASAESRAHQDIKRAETGKLKFLLEAVPKLVNVNLDTNVLEIVDAIERKYGQKIPTRQAQKVKASLTERVKGPCRQCHQLGHTRRQCPQLRTSPPGPMTLPNLERGLSRFANHEGDDGIYANGGLDLNRGEARSMDPVNFQTQQRGHNPLYAQSQPPLPSGTSDYSNMQPNGVPMDSITSNSITRLNSREAQQTAIAQNPQTVAEPNQDQAHNKQTPQGTRLEAAKLMEHAARLMHEAAKLNSEAARLTASVANA